MLVTSDGRGRVNMEAIVVLYGICVVVLLAGLNQASKVKGKLTFYRDALDFARFKRTAPPSVTRDVFLVETDIQGSTSLWEEVSPSVMRRSIDLHNKIMRGLIAVHFGWEVGSEGDAFVIAFHEVKDAAAFCIDLQLSMAWFSCVCAAFENVQILVPYKNIPFHPFPLTFPPFFRAILFFGNGLRCLRVQPDIGTDPLVNE